MPNCQVIFGEGYGVSIFVIGVFPFGLQALTDSGISHPSVDVEPSGSRLEGVHVLVVLTCAAARLHGLFHTIKHTPIDADVCTFKINLFFNKFIIHYVIINKKNAETALYKSTRYISSLYWVFGVLVAIHQ